MFGLDPEILGAIGANVAAIAGAYSSIVQRLTRLETEQKAIKGTLQILIERRLKENEKLRAEIEQGKI